MTLPETVKATIIRFVQKFPLPAGSESAAQEWTHRLCEQLAHSWPGDGWGHKSAGAGRPHSKDVVAIKSPFVGWDIIIGAGTANPVLDLNGEAINLSGQLFEPVTPMDHLGTSPEPPPVTDEVIPLLKEILAELKKQTELLKEML